MTCCAIWILMILANDDVHIKRVRSDKQDINLYWQSDRVNIMIMLFFHYTTAKVTERCYYKAVRQNTPRKACLLEDHYRMMTFYNASIRIVMPLRKVFSDAVLEVVRLYRVLLILISLCFLFFIQIANILALL